MMNMFLHDPNEIRLPPEEVRLTKVEVIAHIKERRVKVHLELTPFMKRPNIEVIITSGNRREVGHINILETMLHILEFTVHLRQVEAPEQLHMETTVYYQKLPEPGASDTPIEMQLPDPMIVDHHSTTIDWQPSGNQG